MQISSRLGLTDDNFARMCLNTKMLLSNVLGHAAESHYENFLKSKKETYMKAPTDQHHDYVVGSFRDQVKRFESNGTSKQRLTINLTQTHGDRSGKDAFYQVDSFDRLVAFDVLFRNLSILSSKDIPRHPKFPNRLNSKVSIPRKIPLEKDQLDVLNLLKVPNKEFPSAMEKFLTEKSLDHVKGLEFVCGLEITEIDSLFGNDNFRLVTGAKGFAAEEHFNVFLENLGVAYRQDRDMYSKVDHWVGDLRVQVKIPHARSVTDSHWAFKTHKSHGHGVGELYQSDMFDIIALFVGFEMDEAIDKYLPVSVKNNFVFIPVSDLPEHPKHPGYLKRVSKVEKSRYKVNDWKY